MSNKLIKIPDIKELAAIFQEADEKVLHHENKLNLALGERDDARSDQLESISRYDDE